MPGPKSKIQILLTGSGGQGLILAGVILAAAAVKEGAFVIQTQSYGPEARGGASRAEVIMDSEPIDFPHVEKTDVLLALTQEACDKYVKQLSSNGVMIVDSLLVATVPPTSAKVLQFPIIKTAQDIGKEVVANIIALGALNAAANLVEWTTLENAILDRVPKAFVEINQRALTTGRSLVEQGKIQENI